MNAPTPNANAIPQPQVEEEVLVDPEKVAIFEKELNALSESLEKQLPGYQDYLKRIDKILKSYPEITYLLKPEQIGVIVKGLIKEADLQLFTKEKKAEKRGAPKLDLSSLDDI